MIKNGPISGMGITLEDIAYDESLERHLEEAQELLWLVGRKTVFTFDELDRHDRGLLDKKSAKAKG